MVNDDRGREPLSGPFIVVRAIRGGARSTPTSVSIAKTTKRDPRWREGEGIRDDGGS